MPFKLKRGRGGQHEKCRSVQEKYGGLSEGTVFAKETKEPNNRVLLGALLLGFIVFFFLLYVICALVPTEETKYGKKRW